MEPVLINVRDLALPNILGQNILAVPSEQFRSKASERKKIWTGGVSVSDGSPCEHS